MKVNDDAREKLLEEVAGLTDDEVNWKPSEDKWSVRQILEHLYLMEGGVAKTIQSQLGSGEHHSTSDKPIERTVDRTQKVEAPDFARPGDTFCKLEELKSKLNESHNGLQKIENTVPADQLEAKSYPHPVFGEMSLAQYIPFVGYHELRHIEQIQEVKEAMHASK
ncbi:DinB family protein [Sporosarcina aquimarina]|uniref:DinB family protein n=1 Tax=Sporosarcina aquimarina TaxID=114975 RepID=A0ABU4G0U6_9BACL|nr:DinB family protein [Sporosarcina aquimarina]MDW0110566.1 DinB family protein [Sporosarcina aquimarina]